MVSAFRRRCRSTEPLLRLTGAAAGDSRFCEEIQMSATERAEAEPKFLDAEGVCARYGGRSLQWILHQLRDNPAFPRPVRIRRHRLWEITKLEEFENQLTKEVQRDAKRKRE
jgi:hypothetical protein